MNRVLPCLLIACALLALPARAQDPKPAAAAPAASEPAKPEPGPGQEPDPKILEGIFDCLSSGLSKDWAKAWFVVSEIERDERSATRRFEANFFYATSASDNAGVRLRTCGPERIIEGVKALNDYLPLNQQRWTSANFMFTSDGKFEVKYDFTPLAAKPAEETPAKKPAARPAAKAAPKKKPDAAK